MAEKPKRGWDANSHEALLLALLDEIKPNKATLTIVAERMRAKGFSYSFDAINQHIQKLRKNRDVSGIEKAGGGTPKSTPSKAGGGIKRKTPSKRTANESSPVVDDDDDFKNFKTQFGFDEEELEVKTPTKKRIKKEKTLLADPDQDEEI
ncbi:hypothetical protein CDD83_10738 [Cordyceps sp. RAO-2017]|nr:hypothetical protein CDD83_10738 [Cordyceps sp. RAO-2017]